MRSNLVIQIAFIILTCSLSMTSYAAASSYPSPAPNPDAEKPISTSITTTSQVPNVVMPAVTPAPKMTPAPNATASTSSAAPTSSLIVGKVVWVKGTFKATTADMKERSLIKADPIYLHDTLVTDSSTQAQIVFTDDTLMTFKPDSSFYIENYTYDKAKAAKGSVGKYFMNLIKGGFRTITGVIAKNNPSDYKVNTPVATIGVRGTDYEVSLEKGELFVGFYEGSPCVTGGNQTMCLDKTHPYAKVPSANRAPVALTQKPAVFREKTPITKATFAATAATTTTTTTTTTTPATPPASTTTTTPLSPDNITLPEGGGVLGSFCIQ